MADRRANDQGATRAVRPAAVQFGVRDLLVLMTVVAVALVYPAVGAFLGLGAFLACTSVLLARLGAARTLIVVGALLLLNRIVAPLGGENSLDVQLIILGAGTWLEAWLLARSDVELP